MASLIIGENRNTTWTRLVLSEPLTMAAQVRSHTVRFVAYRPYEERVLLVATVLKHLLARPTVPGAAVKVVIPRPWTGGDPITLTCWLLEHDRQQVPSSFTTISTLRYDELVAPLLPRRDHAEA